MSLNAEAAHEGLSRRQVLAGLGVATGAATVLSSLTAGGVVAAAPVAGTGAPSAAPVPQAFLAEVAGLTYVLIDPSAFVPVDGSQTRNVDSTNGTFLSAPGNLRAPVVLPKGAVIKQVNFTYIGTPTVSLQRKPFAGASTNVALRTLSSSGPGFQSDNFVVDELVNGTTSYSFNVNITSTDQSIGAVIVGYQAPGGSFVPFTGNPRVLDTRQPGGTKLDPGEERTITLGTPGYAKAAVLNLTITQTEGTFGYVSVFDAGITWPGNSTINWSAANQTLANAVIVPTDAQGRIKIRGGERRTHVIIDVVGALT